jgi:DNA repair exonuclease SbcCD ATPase subunit
MGALRINKITYKGGKYYYESAIFDKNIILIEGPNGTGKSTLFDLLYYGLGGKVDQFSAKSKKKHEEIVFDKNNSVTVDVLIDRVPFTLIRKIGENSILIIQESGDSELFPINRNVMEDYIFSDWILTKLNISVFDINQGSKTFKLNFSDLCRLIYHNQSTDPSLIYKPSENGGFVSDSLYVRKAIFEVLVGKSLLEYYKALSDLKSSLKDRDSAKSLYNEYKNLVTEIVGNNDIKNIQFINNEIEEKESYLEKLICHRQQSIKIAPSPENIISNIDKLKHKKQTTEYKKRKSLEKNRLLTSELSKVIQAKEYVEVDIDRISKVILTHNQLTLFTPDTCPYCLSDVSRHPDKCVCGSDVDEARYQRFFYSSSEYQEILKSKIKSIESFNRIIENLTIDIKHTEKVLAVRDEQLTKVDNHLSDALSELIIEVDMTNLEEIDDKIIELKEDISELFQLKKLEEKLEVYDKDHDKKDKAYKNKDKTFKKKEIDASTQLESRIVEFSKTYNDLMKNSLTDVRKAEIDQDTYLPIINGGVYREASSGVATRFLYFLSLLKISMKDIIPFPKLLLVDTPETAGIDSNNLDLVLSKVQDLETEFDSDFQAIIATGVKKYPDSMEDCVLIRLSKTDRLLKPTSTI